MSENERIAKLESDVAHIKDMFETENRHLRNTLKEIQQELRDKEESTAGWIKSIAVGIILLFAASFVNGVIWLLEWLPQVKSISK